MTTGFQFHCELLFLLICKNSLKQMNKDSDDLSMPSSNNIYHGSTVIISSLIAFEAFINEILRRCFRQNLNLNDAILIEKLLEKMGFDEKVEFIYKINNAIREEDNNFKVIRLLKKNRDWLVHFKHERYIEFYFDEEDEQYTCDFIPSSKKKRNIEKLKNKPFSYNDCYCYYTAVISSMIKILELFGEKYALLIKHIQDEDFRFISGLSDTYNIEISFDEK